MVVYPLVKTKTTPLEEYRTWEENAEFRSEYHDGEIVPMTGGTIAHNTIVLNLVVLLKTALGGKNYHVQSSDLRLWVPQYRRGLYPDVMVIAGEPAFHEHRPDEVLNPCLIVEVLSKSTASYDRGDKFLYYRSIPEFREYLLVEQSDYGSEHYFKTGERQWLLEEDPSSEGRIHLESVGVTFTVGEIYAGVNFDLADL